MPEFISLNKKLRESAVKENVIPSGELTWLANEMAKMGSVITRNQLVQLYLHGNIVGSHFEREVKIFEDFIVSKRTLVRKLRKSIPDLNRKRKSDEIPVQSDN